MTDGMSRSRKKFPAGVWDLAGTANAFTVTIRIRNGMRKLCVNDFMGR